MIKEQWKVEGLRELGKALEGLVEATRKRIIRRALRKAAQPVLATAKRMAPVLKKPRPERRAGTLRNAIRIAGVKSEHAYQAAVKVGVKRLSRKAMRLFSETNVKSNADNPNDPFYARFIEYGTSKMPANPFLRPALHAHRHSAVADIRKELKVEIEAEARRQARRNRPKRN